MYDNMSSKGGMLEGSRHISKSEVKNALSGYLSSMGRQVTCIDEISDTPQVSRHACLGGVGGLFELPQEVFLYLDLTIPYYYCSYCGKVRVWLDF